MVQIAVVMELKGEDEQSRAWFDGQGEVVDMNRAGSLQANDQHEAMVGQAGERPPLEVSGVGAVKKEDIGGKSRRKLAAAFEVIVRSAERCCCPRCCCDVVGAEAHESNNRKC